MELDKSKNTYTYEQLKEILAQMELDKSKNTYTDEQLKEILAQHELWLNTNGKQGQQADFSNTFLMDITFEKADFDYANLDHANFEKAYLKNANFDFAGLLNANFKGANLQRASFAYATLVAVNFEGADLRGANISNANLSGSNLTKAELENAVLYGANLSNTNLQDANLIRANLLGAKFDGANLTNTKFLDDAARVLFVREHASEAEKELDNSLDSAKERVSEHSKAAKIIGLVAIFLIGLDIFAIIYFWLHYENFIPLFEKLGAWSLTLFSFPVIVILTIGITLFRHQKKLLDEVRHYSAEKRQIELYSGLLKASQHAAAGLNDPQKSAEYVQETFTAIRNRILSEQPHSNTAASASEKEDYSVAEIVKGLVDLVAKNDAKK